MKKKKFVVLGINHGGHDTSAAIGLDSQIVAACEQERYDLIKHSTHFPINAIEDCLNISGQKIDDVNEIAVTVDFHDLIRRMYLEPALKSKERLNFLIDDIERVKSYNNFEKIIRKKLNFKGKINTYRHHLCHLASTYYPSGFKDALLLSNDGFAEYETGMLGIGLSGKIKIKDYIAQYPDSLGSFYSAITYFLGWKHHCDEGIIMGLAPYGNPNEKIPGLKETYIEIFRKIIIDKKYFNYKINEEWIAYHIKRDTWVSEKFKKTFGEVRKKDDKLEAHHKNIAAALQLRLEEIVLNKIKLAKKKYKFNRLCIAGGVGLNCTLNGKIAKSKIFKEIFVQPASGDSGVALGAVYLAMANNLKEKRLPVKKRYNHYLGSRFSENDYEKAIKNKKLKYIRPKNIYEETSRLLVDGKIVAWFNGPSEFGPRALGNRSIICRPYPEKMRDYLNNRVKFREYFRPFAPAVLEEFCKEYFKINQTSPHMLIACDIIAKTKNEIPAVVHIDNSCRVQTVSKKTNPNFYNLIKNFYKITKCPVILNTSFNVKGQPMINTPEQALDTFLKTNIDILVLGNFLLKK